MTYFRALSLLLTFCTMFAVACTRAQDATDPNFATGLKPFGSYHGGNIDNVQLFNGQLTLDIPLMSYPQRGGKLKLDYHLRYANVGATDSPTCYQTPGGQICVWTPAAVLVPGWCGVSGMLCHGFRIVDEDAIGDFISGHIVSQNTTILSGTEVYMPDGGTHPLAPTSGNSTSSLWESLDATSFQLGLGNGSWALGSGYYNAPGTTVVDSAGTKYVYPSSGQPYRQDTNGNAIDYGASGSGVLATDTMGRTIPSIPATTSNVSGCPQPPSVPYAPSSASTWSLPGVNGGTFPILFCYVQLSETNPIGTECLGVGVCTAYNYTGTELQSVVLPNGTSWTFEYTTDGNADLAEVIFPTGGTLSYGSYQNFNAGNCSQSIDYNRAVGVRTLNPNDGVTPSSTWSYAYSGTTRTVSAPPSSGSTPDDTLHTFIDPDCSPFENETQYYQGSHTSGTLLKTVATQFSYSNLGWLTPVVNAVPLQVTTTWANGQQAKTTYTYDAGYTADAPDFAYASPYNLTGGASGTGIYGKALTKNEYDYGGSSPLRTTTSTFLALNNSSYLSANLLDLPSSVQVTGSGPGSNTTYGYDTSGCTSGTCGNLTSVNRWLNTTSTYLTTSYVFGSNGLITSSTDPKGNLTTYGYAPSSCPANSGYAGSGPTSVKNALNQTTSNCYDLTTGLSVSTTDPNNQLTSYAYDSMLRTLQVDNPDGGETLFCYTDTGTESNGGTCTKSNPPYEAVISEKITSSANRLSYLMVDGVGRKIRQAVTNGESVSYDEADTCYNGMGRVSFNSYPFQDSGPFTTSRSCGSPELGDSFAYDALSRKTSVTHSDASTVLTSYTGRATSVQDEGNGTQRVQRVSQVDGLGRLVSLCEVTSSTLAVGITGSTTPAACGQDIAATGFLTTYAYDALDDLTSVAQGPLNARTFVYDSLSRLTSSANPEAGTTSYTYDADGNVITKKDARGTTICYGAWSGSTCNGAVGYDAINELLEKSYSDGTPTATYNYGQGSAMGVTLTNTIGRRSSESTAGTNPTGSVFSYDPTGRVNINSQCTPQNCSGTPFSIVYTYDLLGDVHTSTNGAAVTLTNSYNAGARLTSFTSSLSDSNHPGTPFGYQNVAHYNAAGSILSVTLGNGINETRAYDGRLRLTGITDGSVYTLTIPSGYAPNNDILAANDSVNGNWTYGYDGFNRLTGSNQNSGQNVFSYLYDRFGNRWKQNVTAGTGPAPSYGFDANNHIVAGSGVTYDAAGDTTDDGTTTYTFDAEGRIITASNGMSGASSYVYDAGGRRVRKTTVAGGTVDFLYDLAGHEVSQINSTGSWTRGEVYAGGRHVATYSGGTGGTTYFIHADWLATERARSNVSGALCESITSLPFGDAMTTSGSCSDVSPMHFTGKEHDTETGLENFGARYDASSMGRFMTPDWSGKPQGVPYAEFGDPQSLSLYDYVRNNPTTRLDQDGHDDGVLGAMTSISLPMGLYEEAHNPELVQGAEEILAGVGTMGASVELAVAGRAFGAAVGLISGEGTTVMGGTRIGMTASGHDAKTTDEKAGSIGTVTNPAGYVVTAGAAILKASEANSLKAGDVASTVSSAASLARNPAEAQKNPADALLTASSATKALSSAASVVRNVVTPPAAPTPPKPPICTSTSSCVP